MRTFIVIALSLALLQVAYTEVLRPQVAPVTSPQTTPQAAPQVATQAAPQASGALASGIYTIIDAASGLSLDIKNKSYSDGASLTMSKVENTNSQRFLIHIAGNDSYYISNIYTNKFLTISPEGVVQLVLAYTKEQEWTANKTADGSYIFASKVNGQALTIEGKSTFKVTPSTWIETEEGIATDRLVMMAFSTHTGKKETAGTYHFMVIDSPDVLEAVDNNKVRSSKLNHSLTSQEWKVEPVGENFKIVNVKTGQALAVNSTEVASEIITVAVAEKDDKQLWKLEETSESMWNVINVASGLAATAPGIDGEKIVQEHYATARLQLYNIHPAGGHDE